MPPEARSGYDTVIVACSPDVNCITGAAKGYSALVVFERGFVTSDHGSDRFNLKGNALWAGADDELGFDSSRPMVVS